MAFRTVNQWRVERQILPSIGGAFPSPVALGLITGERSQKVFSGAFALGLQGAFLYLLAMGLSGQFGESSEMNGADAKRVTIIPINQEDVKSETSIDKQNNSASRSLQTRTTKTEGSTATEIPAEWTIAKVSVSLEVGPSDNKSPVSSGSKHGEIYDPFAGAAPNRKGNSDGIGRISEPEVTLAGRITGFFESNPEQKSENAFELWVEEIRTRLPRAKGSVELTVSLGPDGTVKSGTVTGGSASPQVKFFVRNAVVGKKFPRLADSQEHEALRLPSISFS